MNEGGFAKSGDDSKNLKNKNKMSSDKYIDRNNTHGLSHGTVHKYYSTFINPLRK